jgi:hypothetical protein
MESRRRTNEVVGYVNFPIDTVRSSGEGGCFVRLIVVESDEAKKLVDGRWAPCCGGYNYFLLDETFLRFDKENPPEEPTFDDGPVTEESRQEYKKFEKDHQEYERKIFPNLGTESPADDYKQEFESDHLLAVLTIGATGWSPEFGATSWHCTYADLTDEGKKLYDLIKALYAPQGVVYLLTFLDT